MEFKTLRNIENSFRQIRLYAIVFAVLCISVVGYTVWRSYRFAEEQRQKIYVLDNGKSLMLALSQDASINRPVEAREHVRRFHELFFTLAPDKNAIESKMAFGKHIKRLRESKGLFLREVGAALELDSAFISKVENEERPLPRKHIEKLADFLNTPVDGLLILWFSDKIIELLQNEPVAEQVLKISRKRLKKE